MLLEAVNSVFITYLATEYLLFSNSEEAPNNSRKLASSFISSHQSVPLRRAFIIVASINIFVRFHAAGAALASWIHLKLGVEALFHIPRIVVAICSFFLALYFDCRQKHKRNCKNQSSPAPWSNRHFLREVLKSLCRLLPVYPFLAVVISFGFLFVITAFEKLHLPLQVLNTPIYYGTLYGPLMVMYWDVKKVVAGAGNVLPR